MRKAEGGEEERRWILLMVEGMGKVDNVVGLRNRILVLRRCLRCGRMTRSMMCPRCRKEEWKKFVNSGGLERWI